MSLAICKKIHSSRIHTLFQNTLRHLDEHGRVFSEWKSFVARYPFLNALAFNREKVPGRDSLEK